MSTSPILTNIVKRGVVPVLKPIQADGVKQENIVPSVTDTQSDESNQLNIDDIESLIDTRLQKLKTDLMHDIKQAIQNKQ